MEGIIEEHIISDIINREDKKNEEKLAKVSVPVEKNLLCHLLFFLMGVCHFLPITFFSAANNFWLHKFQNTTSDSSDEVQNRTVLQRYFAPATLMTYAVSSLTFGIFNLTVGNRYKIMNRLIFTLCVESVVFILLTIGVKVNTNNFQITYFFLVLMGYATLQGANAVNLVASMNLFPRFPHKYMNTCLVGQGTAGVLGDILNIMAVGMFNGDITNATLFYFIVGCGVVLLTLVLTTIVSKSSFFILCVSSVPQDFDKTLVPSVKDLKHLFFKLKYAAIMLTYFVLGITLTHPSITALVVSEQHEENTSWARSYFSPVMSFLLSDLGLLLGRVAVSHLPIELSKIERLLSALSTIRTLILIPLVWMCNAQPRSHLPILFPRDYQYGIVLFIFMFTNGGLVNGSLLLIPEKVDKREADMAYTMYGFALSLVHTITSPLGLFIVNVL
ncbi:equilibrative nucleoside transporter 3-like [Euwallacea similis]|uniref:equilibrative nucleoside transporter 3-like n=1 Tax=Euwallacea similis TaxID=1736056 RepID=UPI00344E3465